MISVVIPCLNAPLIDQVVAALYQQTAREQIAEIIVVGQDRTGRVPASVRFVATPRPLPAAAARNLGARQAQGELLLFLDADCIAAPDLLAQLLECYRQGQSVVGGSVALEPDNYWVLCDNLLVFGPFLATAPAGERRYLPSLNLSLRRSLFLELGGFDERFPGAAGEDIDFSLRLRERGHPLWFEPRARIYHRPQRSSAQAIWQHLRSFGRVHVRLQQMHRGRAAPRLGMHLRPWSGAIIAAAPLLALADVLLFYRANPPLRAYWTSLPGLVWGKTAWYWGVAESLMNQRQEDREEITL